MLHKFFTSKKAAVEDWLPTILIIVFLVFFSIFMFYPSQLKAAEKRTISELSLANIESEQFLVDFLSFPSENKGNRDIADLIVLYFSNRDQATMEEVKKASGGFFTGLETERSSWSLVINHKSGNINLESPRFVENPVLRSKFGTKKELSKLDIPTHDPNEKVEVKLFLNTI
ncbi:hypothetical protein ISS07_01440 [Candidatus Woesearchaeota archaeon]|nr:hypothetical protein [Candidatus Woesearchaeota archaeon]